MGTNVFFSEKPDTPEPDISFKELPSKMYEYFGKTSKVLKMKRIFVEENEGSAGEGGPAETETDEQCLVKKTYEEALNQFLEPGQEPPRKITANESELMENQEMNEALENEQQSDEQMEIHVMKLDPDYVPE